MAGKGLIILIVIILAVAGGYFLFMQKPVTTPADAFDSGINELKAIWGEKGINMDSEVIATSDALKNATADDMLEIKAEFMNFKANTTDEKLKQVCDIYIDATGLLAKGKELAEKIQDVKLKEDTSQSCSEIDKLELINSEYEDYSNAASALSEKLNAFVSSYPSEAKKANVFVLKPNLDEVSDSKEELIAIQEIVEFYCM